MSNDVIEEDNDTTKEALKVAKSIMSKGSLTFEFLIDNKQHKLGFPATTIEEENITPDDIYNTIADYFDEYNREFGTEIDVKDYIKLIDEKFICVNNTTIIDTRK